MWLRFVGAMGRAPGGNKTTAGCGRMDTPIRLHHPPAVCKGAHGVGRIEHCLGFKGGRRQSWPLRWSAQDEGENWLPHIIVLPSVAPSFIM